jgi:DNA-binding NtrC family response regulator
MGKTEKSIDILEELVDTLSEDDKLYAMACNNLGKYLLVTERLPEALEYFLKTVDFFSQSEDLYNKSMALNNVASIYHRMGFYDKAISYFEEALDIRFSIDNLQGIPNILYNLGICYSYKKEIEKSKSYFLKAEELLKDSDVLVDKINIYHSLTGLAIEENKLEDAERYSKLEIEIATLSDDKEKIIKAKINNIRLKIALLRLNNLSSQLKNIEDEIAERSFDYLNDFFYEVYLEFLHATKDYDKLLHHSLKFLDNTKEIYKKNYADDVAEMQVRYETERKTRDAEIYKLKNIELVEKNKTIEKQHFEILTAYQDLKRAQPEFIPIKDSGKIKLEDMIIGNSESTIEIRKLVTQLAHAENTSVLITGESGTGKELYARTLHMLSIRGFKPFYAVNAAVIDENMFESELFGHEKYSFTGADQMKIGWFEIADKGTLFLDEINGMPISQQMKLLRALEEKVVYRVGSRRAIPFDTRIISASSLTKEHLLENNIMREDLYHRISSFALHIPPLRDRPDDIEPLLHHFVTLACAKLKKHITQIDKRVIHELLSYAFPGNVRELKNIVERAIIMTNGSKLHLEHFSLGNKFQESEVESIKTIAEMEEEMINRALKKANFNQSKAAKMLGLSPKAIERRMVKYGISRKFDR